MAVKSGFFNSIDHDRQYTSEDISEIFNGLFSDGVFQDAIIGGDYYKNKSLRVYPDTGMMLYIGPGKAWFNNVWIMNDGNYPIVLSESNMILNRYDAIVLEINKNLHVRKANFVVYTGEAADVPEKPVIQTEENIFRYVLAYVYVPANVDSIISENIENQVGTESLPFSKYIGVDMDILLANNLSTTDPGKALDAVQGKVLDDKITAANGRVTTSNNNISTANTNITKAQNSITAVSPFKFSINNGKYGYLDTSGNFVAFASERVKELTVDEYGYEGSSDDPVYISDTFFIKNRFPGWENFVINRNIFMVPTKVVLTKGEADGDVYYNGPLNGAGTHDIGSLYAYISTSINSNDGYDVDKVLTPSITYDKSTGKIKINNSRMNLALHAIARTNMDGSASKSISLYIQYKVYVVY